MKKLLILVVTLLIVFTGCGNESTNEVQTLPKVKKDLELVCVGDFSEDLKGSGEMYQKVELVFDNKGVKYKSGTIYVDVGLYEENITDNYMNTFKKYLDEKICKSENTKYDTCEIEIDENIAHIKATGDKKALTGFSNDEDIDLVKKAFEEGGYSCLIR